MNGLYKLSVFPFSFCLPHIILTVLSVSWTDLKNNKSDQTVLAVGIVFGLIVALIVMGLAYWLYMKKFRYWNNMHISNSKDVIIHHNLHICSICAYVNQISLKWYIM